MRVEYNDCWEGDFTVKLNQRNNYGIYENMMINVGASERNHNNRDAKCYSNGMWELKVAKNLSMEIGVCPPLVASATKYETNNDVLNLKKVYNGQLVAQDRVKEIGSEATVKHSQ